jgi:hypothetical protein
MKKRFLRVEGSQAERVGGAVGTLSDPPFGKVWPFGKAWHDRYLTALRIDPKERLAVMFRSQGIGSEARLTLRHDLRTLIQAAMTGTCA